MRRIGGGTPPFLNHVQDSPNAVVGAPPFGGFRAECVYVLQQEVYSYIERNNLPSGTGLMRHSQGGHSLLHPSACP